MLTFKHESQSTGCVFRLFREAMHKNTAHSPLVDAAGACRVGEEKKIAEDEADSSGEMMMRYQ
jgi:hypothetical protein